MISHPKTLEVLLQRRGLNQRELADKMGVSVKTISRIKSGKPPNPSTLEGVVRVLNTTREELAAPPSDQTSASEALKAAGYRRLSTHISGRRAVQYALVEARYGVSAKALIEMAPLLVTLLAEMSLADRRAGLRALRDARNNLVTVAPSHLHGVWRADLDLDDALESEEASIDAADIRGAEIEDGQAVDDRDLFVSYLQKLTVDLDGSHVAHLDGSIDWIDYDILEEDLSRITNGVPLAEYALTGGHARAKDIPEHLRTDDRAAERAEWLAAQVPEAAKAEWEAQRKLFDDLIGPTFEAAPSHGEASDE